MPRSVDGFRELFEAHVRDGQVVFDAPGLRWNDSERSPGLVVEVDDQNRMVGIQERDAIGNQDEGVLCTGRSLDNRVEACALVDWITEKGHVGAKLADRFSNSNAEGLRGNIIAVVRTKQQGIRSTATVWRRATSGACHDVAMAKEHVYRNGDRVEVRRPAVGDWIPGHVLGRKQVNGVTRYLIQLSHSPSAEAKDPNNWYTTDRLRAA